jgi:cytochrome c5
VKTSLRRPGIALAVLLAAPAALAATGEETYKAKCSLCHDSGATAAPRVDDRAAWTARLANGREPVYQTALKGKPATAMLPKGGFPELPDADVLAAVDYMLARTGYRDAPLSSPRAASAAPAGPAPAGRTGAVDDRTLTAEVAEALRSARDISPANAQVETVEGAMTVRGTGIRIQVRDGVVTLQGVVEEAKVVARAEAIARSVGGVRGVDNKLISSGIFEHD